MKDPLTIVYGPKVYVREHITMNDENPDNPETFVAIWRGSHVSKLRIGSDQKYYVVKCPRFWEFQGLRFFQDALHELVMNGQILGRLPYYGYIPSELDE